jgi:hypothetical protein
MSIEDKAELIIAVRNYKCEKRKKWSDSIDFTVSDVESDEKILLRTIEPQSKAGFVGVDDVKKMLKAMKSEDCHRGVLIGKRFTTAAAEEMATEKIQQVSDEYMPPFNPEKLYLTINDRVNDLCRARCNDIPLKQSDCKAFTAGSSCRVRTVSNNALFHFERGWTCLLKDDLKQLLSLRKSVGMQ